MKIINIKNKKGVLNEDGNTLIECKYDVIEYLQDCNCYKCGRDGELQKGKMGLVEREFYSGVYDLYSNSGELLLGGFGDFHYNSTFDLFFFHFGGHWSISKWHNEYLKRDGKWVVFDKKIEPIFDWNSYHYSSGYPLHFKGTIVTCFTEKHQDTPPLKFVRLWQSHIIDLPAELMFEDYVIDLQCKQIVVRTNLFYRTIFLQAKKISDAYNYISPIDEESAYTLLNGSGLGIATANSSKGIYNAYNYVTKPYKGWSLAIGSIYSYPCVPKEHEGMRFCVLLNNEKMWNPYLLFRDIHYKDVEELLQKRILKIEDIELNSKKELVSITFPKQLCDFVKFDEKIVSKVKTCNAPINKTMPHKYYESLSEMKYRMEHRGRSDYDYQESYDTLNDAFDGEAELYNDWLLN